MNTAFLGAASQRIDHVIIELIGTPWMKSLLEDWRKHERGAFPGIFECFVILYVLSMYCPNLMYIYRQLPLRPG